MPCQLYGPWNRFHGVFPAHWKVELCLLMTFLQTTRQHILDTLEGTLVSSLHCVDCFVCLYKLSTFMPLKRFSMAPPSSSLLHPLVFSYLSNLPLRYPTFSPSLAPFMASTISFSPAGGPESEDVTVLLKALQKALLFEKEMQPRFQPTQVFFLSPCFPL